VGTADNWTSASAGSTHSLALRADGTMWAFGENAAGRTGFGSTAGNTLVPAQVGTATHWAHIASGLAYSLALADNGVLWGFGTGATSRLGIPGNVANQASPIAINVRNITATSPADNAVDVPLTSNLVITFSNNMSQLPEHRGTVTLNGVPVDVSAATWTNNGTTFSIPLASGLIEAADINTVSASGFHMNHGFPAIVEDRTWTFYGLGSVSNVTKILHTPADRPVPAGLEFDFQITPVSFGGATTPEALANFPTFGQPGPGNSRILTMPIDETNSEVTVSGGTRTLTRAFNILQGASFFAEGVYIFHVTEIEGSSGLNQLGGLASVDYSEAEYTLEIIVSGTGANATLQTRFWADVPDGAARAGQPMYSWGNNSTGQLGLGHTDNAASDNTSPQRVGEADNWMHVASFAGGTIATNSEGHLYVWGGPRNSPMMGRGGEGTGDITSPERLDIPGASSDFWINVDGGGSTGTNPAGYMIAINDAGEMWSWGHNTQGQLGLGDTTHRNTPQRVPGTQSWAQVNVVSMSAAATADGAASFALAITEEGNLYSWGRNVNSQLGRTPDVANPASLPGRVNSPAGVSADFYWRMARPGGASAAFGIGSDGQIYSWGLNANSTAWTGDQVGQLGRAGATSTIPTLTEANAPDSPATHVTPPVTGWVDVVQQVNDPRVTVALSECGRLFSWGAGTSTAVDGLGRPGGAATSATRTNRPVQIGTANNWVAIGGGNAHTIAINEYGSMYSWGRNLEGQLGLGGHGHTGDMPAATAGPRFVLQTTGLEGFSQTGSGLSSFALIRTDPMVFTNTYTIEEAATTTANLSKVLTLHESLENTLELDFSFHITRYSFNGDTAQVSLLPLVGTAVTSQPNTGAITLTLNESNSTVAPATGERLTFTRTTDILNGIYFDRAGTFVYYITEVEGSSSSSWPSLVEYSEAEYRLTVTVTGSAGNFSTTATIQQLVNDGGTPNTTPVTSTTIAFANTYIRQALPTGLVIQSASYAPFVAAAGLGLAFIARKKRKSIEELGEAVTN